MTTTNLLLGGLLICQCLVLLFGLVLGNKLKSYLLRNARSFFEPGRDGEGKATQSPFADILDNIGNRLAAAIIASVKGWLMAQNSAAVRQEKAETRQQFLANAPPAMGALAAFAPGLMKKAMKHPELAQMAMQFMGNMGGQRKEETASNNGNHAPSNPFKI